MMFNSASDKELREELKRRSDARQGMPLWVREPVWYRIYIWLGAFYFGCIATALSPLWAPFWFAGKLYTDGVKGNRLKAERDGHDWKRFHPNDE